MWIAKAALAPSFTALCQSCTRIASPCHDTRWLDVDSEDDTRTILHTIALWLRAARGLRVTVSQPATRWPAHEFPRAAGLRKTIHGWPWLATA
jgi:hypothetical protein